MIRRVCSYPSTPGVYHDAIYSVRADAHHAVDDLSVAAAFQADVCRDHLVHAISLPVDNLGLHDFHLTIITPEENPDGR